jgi:antitoxin (DNA-binding transcriptional repressor) of toxin-antitoxin stability system
MSEPAATVHAEDEPSWAEVVRHAEHGESVSVIAHGDHVADVVPSGELERLRETIAVLSDNELVRGLREDLVGGP